MQSEKGRFAQNERIEHMAKTDTATEADEAAPQGAQRVIERKQGFGVRDLVSVGIFTVVNLVVFYLCAMTGIVPIMAFLYPLPIALLLGIPNMLFFTKTHRFGMVTVMGTLLGLFLINQGPLALVFGFVMGLASDLILRAGTYRSARCAVAAHCVFSLWTVGTMLPMWILGQAYFEPFRASQGDAFVNQMMDMLSIGMLGIIVVGIVVCGLLGALLGRVVLRRHFERAGIA